MGFNTVAMLLNDHMDSLEKSPKSLTYALTHPPLSNDIKALNWFNNTVAAVAHENNEPNPLHNGLSVLPTFHADNMQILHAGHNSIYKFEVVKTDRKNNTITLKVPDWYPIGSVK